MRLLTSSIIVTIAAFVAGCNPTASIPSSDPVADRDREMRGFIYNPDAISITEDEFAWVQQAISDYRRTGERDVPARVGHVDAADCRFAAPGPGELAFHAHVGDGVQATPIHWTSETDVRRRAERVIDGYLRELSPQALERHVLDQDQIRVVNVVVTETSSPVYLVLSAQDVVVWNIQAHPEAEITRIAMVGHHGAGIANVPEGTKVSALVGANAQRCRALPERMPRDDWGFIANASSNIDDVVQENVKDARRYSRWLRETFGLGTAFAGALGVSNVLLGPLPASEEARVPFRPIQGSDLLFTRGGHLFPAGVEQYRTGIFQAVSESLKSSGGAHIVEYMQGS